MKTVRQAIDGMLNMSDISYRIFCRTLILSCVLLFSAFIFLIEAGEYNIDTYRLYLYALECIRTPPALLILTAIGTVCIDERFGNFT